MQKFFFNDFFVCFENNFYFCIHFTSLFVKDRYLTTIKKIGLLPHIIIAIILGVLTGNVLPEMWVRVFVTFNYVFSQFLGFLIPLIIIGLVTPAIADIGRGAGRLLLLTVRPPLPNSRLIVMTNFSFLFIIFIFVLVI